MGEMFYFLGTHRFNDGDRQQLLDGRLPPIRNENGFDPGGTRTSSMEAI